MPFSVRLGNNSSGGADSKWLEGESGACSERAVLCMIGVGWRQSEACDQDPASHMLLRPRSFQRVAEPQRNKVTYLDDLLRREIISP